MSVTETRDNGVTLRPYPWGGSLLTNGLMAPSGAFYMVGSAAGNATGGIVTINIRIVQPSGFIWLVKNLNTFHDGTGAQDVLFTVDSGVTLPPIPPAGFTGDHEFAWTAPGQSGFGPANSQQNMFGSVPMPPMYVDGGRMLAFTAIFTSNVNFSTYQLTGMGYYWDLMTARLSSGLYIP